jgi:NADH:ubiquinone oxidoreductase subunit E
MYDLQNLESINPDLNSDVMSQVDEIIDRNKGKPGCLIPVLEEVQGVAGYLPVEVQEYIGSRLNIPGSNIYGVVSFYSLFTMVPKGRHMIKVCLGTACYVRGSKPILKRLSADLGLEVGQTTEDRRFSLESVRCLGACGLAPTVVIDEDTHGLVWPDKMSDILSQYE